MNGKLFAVTVSALVYVYAENLQEAENIATKYPTKHHYEFQAEADCVMVKGDIDSYDHDGTPFFDEKYREEAGGLSILELMEKIGDDPVTLKAREDLSKRCQAAHQKYIADKEASC